MKTCALWLDLLAALMVLGGLLWGAYKLKVRERELTKIKDQLRAVDEEAKNHPWEPGSTVDWASEEKRRLGLPFTSFDDLMFVRQSMELAVISHLKPTLSAPFLLATGGTAFGVVVNLLNLIVG